MEEGKYFAKTLEQKWNYKAKEFARVGRKGEDLTCRDKAIAYANQ